MPALLLLLLLAVASLASASVPPEVCRDGCNFTWLQGQLDRTLGLAAGADGVTPWSGAAFASALVSLNLRLRQQLTLATRCTRRWLSRDPGGCPEPSLGGLTPALAALKADVKLSFTQLSSQRGATPEYQSAVFDILNVYSGAFFDFVRQLATGDSDQARVELATFRVFYAKLQRTPRPLTAAVAAAACAADDRGGGGNATAAGASGGSAASEDDCLRRGRLWRSAVGVALQNLVMCEVTASAAGDEATEAAWLAYATIADCVTQLALRCERAAGRGGFAGVAGGGGGRDGRGDPASSATGAGLGSANIALAVLIPTLLLLLAVAVALAICGHRRRRWRQQRSQQAMQDRAAAPSGCEEAEKMTQLSPAHKQQQQQRGGGGSSCETAPDLLSESAAMVQEVDSRYIDDPDVV